MLFHQSLNLLNMSICPPPSFRPLAHQKPKFQVLGGVHHQRVQAQHEHVAIQRTRNIRLLKLLLQRHQFYMRQQPHKCLWGVFYTSFCIWMLGYIGMFKDREASWCLALHNSTLSGRGSYIHFLKFCSIVLQHRLTCLPSPYSVPSVRQLLVFNLNELLCLKLVN